MGVVVPYNDDYCLQAVKATQNLFKLIGNEKCLSINKKVLLMNELQFIERFLDEVNFSEEPTVDKIVDE